MSSLDSLLGDIISPRGPAADHSPFPPTSPTPPVIKPLIPRPPSLPSTATGQDHTKKPQVRPGRGGRSFTTAPPTASTEPPPPTRPPSLSAPIPSANGPLTGDWDEWDEDNGEPASANAEYTLNKEALSCVGGSRSTSANSRESDVDSLLAEMDMVDSEALGSALNSSVLNDINEMNEEGYKRATKLPVSISPTATTNAVFGNYQAASTASSFPPPSTSQPTSQPAPSVSSSLNSLPKKKCVFPVLGPPSSTPGLTSGMLSGCCCSKLRCLHCSFTVCRLPSLKWSPTVDYIFFRNTTPNIPKLAAQCDESDDHTSYCCQCSWVTVDSIGKVNTVKHGSQPELRWVCAGHT